jgi:hypothetical protein
MQRFHRRVRPPKRYAVNDQALAVAVEQIASSGAAQPLANRPNMGFDDRAAERTVERRDVELRV